MGRIPCCENTGLKKGSWSKEEDEILISYIQQHGHPNWRALPKRAGLLRCGKSCRLRWNNYLRPDIKRGNFTAEEEDTIIQLHQMLGNRWSVIAAKLPGRTDNEIKNVWHTYLKKRADSHRTIAIHDTENHQTKSKCTPKALCLEESNVSQSHVKQEPKSLDKKCFSNVQPSSSESSSMTNSISIANHETFLDDSFWFESLSGKEENAKESELSTSVTLIKNTDTMNQNIGYSTDELYLWYDMFTSIGESHELPEFRL